MLVENNIPFFGICLGMQCAVIEFARNVLGWKDAFYSRSKRNNPHLIYRLNARAKKILII